MINNVLLFLILLVLVTDPASAAVGSDREAFEAHDSYVAGVYEELRALPVSDDWRDDSLLILTEAVDALEAASPRPCYADRFVVDLEALRLFRTFLAYDSDEQVAAASNRLGTYLFQYLSPQVPVSC